MHSKTKYAIIGISVILAAFVLVSYTRWPIDTPLSQYINPRGDYYLTTEKMVYEVIGDLSKIRRLNGPNQIKIQIVTVEWTKEHWGREISQSEIEQIKMEEEIYKALFLVPQDYDLVEKKVQEAGYILAALAGDTLYFVSDYFDPYNEVAAKECVAHECAHLLQSVNFVMEEPVDLDAKLAKNALIEGEAEVQKAKYMEFAFNKTVEKSQFPTGNRILDVDEFFWLKWVTPGMFGIEFVDTLYALGGWSMVNEVFTNMPDSMEQVMHPDKYLSNEVYTEPETEEIEGWKLEKSDRFGELFISLFLSRHIPIDEARIAAEGWNGDKFIYFKKNDDFFYAWKTLWDTTKDKEEFVVGLEKTFQSLGAEKIAPQMWKINGNYVTVEVDNLNVTITSTSNYETLKI